MRSLAFLLFAAALSACSPYSPDLGGAPFLCDTDEPRCPDGFACQNDATGRMVCVSESGSVVDAAPGGFQCEDDSNLETPGRNDTIQTAYATPFMPGKKTIMLARIAICPEGDKDTYSVNITTANSNLEAVSSWESGMPISVSILGSGGATLTNGTSSGERSLRAYVANLPVSTYYVQVYAAANVKNNYNVTITIAP